MNSFSLFKKEVETETEVNWDFSVEAWKETETVSTTTETTPVKAEALVTSGIEDLWLIAAVVVSVFTAFVVKKLA